MKIALMCVPLLLVLASCGPPEPTTARECAEAYFRAQAAFDIDRMMELTAENSREASRAQIETQLSAKRENIERMVITVTDERVEGDHTIITFHQVTHFKDGKRNEFDAQRRLVRENGKWRVE